MRRFVVSVCLILLCTSVSFADIITVQPEGDGQSGKARYGFSYGWESTGFNSNANPNNVGHRYDSGSANGLSLATWMQVSLAGMPEADAITGATLNINILSLQGASTISNVYHAANSSAATGNASQQISCNEFVAAITDSTGTGWFSMDVTDFIKNDLNNGYGYASFKFNNNSYKWMTFSSAESDQAPYLAYVPEPVTMALLGIGGLIAVRRNRQ